MKYTRESIKEGLYFIKVDNSLIEELRGLINISCPHLRQSRYEDIKCLGIGLDPGWMSDNGEWYIQHEYTEVFPWELDFLKTQTYEIY